MMLKIRKVEKKSRGDDKPAPRITESDNYVAHLVKVEKFKSKRHPDWDESFRFIFRVLETRFMGGFASGITPSMWYKGGKLDSWLKMLGVEQSTEGDELDVHSIRGQKVRIVVKISDDGFANVTDLLEMRDRDHELIDPKAFDNNFNKTKEEDNKQTTVQTQAAPAGTTASPVQATVTPATPATPAPATPAPDKVEAKVEAKVETKVETKVEPKAEPKVVNDTKDDDEIPF